MFNSNVVFACVVLSSSNDCAHFPSGSRCLDHVLTIWIQISFFPQFLTSCIPTLIEASSSSPDMYADVPSLMMSIHCQLLYCIKLGCAKQKVHATGLSWTKQWRRQRMEQTLQLASHCSSFSHMPGQIGWLVNTGGNGSGIDSCRTSSSGKCLLFLWFFWRSPKNHQAHATTRLSLWLRCRCSGNGSGIDSRRNSSGGKCLVFFLIFWRSPKNHQTHASTIGTTNRNSTTTTTITAMTTHTITTTTTTITSIATSIAQLLLLPFPLYNYRYFYHDHYHIFTCWSQKEITKKSKTNHQSITNELT